MKVTIEFDTEDAGLVATLLEAQTNGTKVLLAHRLDAGTVVLNSVIVKKEI